MKIRPQKHVRQGFSGKSKLQRSRSQPKTRKEIRKEKRQQKKINRFNYHSRKRSDRYGGGDKEDGDPLEKVKRRKGGESDEDEDEWDDDDEEIDSDLGEDVAEEKEEVPEVVKKGKGKKVGLSQLEREREEELRELKNYEQGLREKRIAQLEAANAEDDAIIKKYEKLLKINRRKNKDGVPKSFNDGLDYALELCTEENIRKMYDAAREAAELEQNSEDEFADDMGEVLGKKDQKLEGKGKKKLSDKDRKRMEKLKEVERKYLGDDEMDDGSLGGFDSELEIELASDYSENDELYDSEEDAPVEKSNGKQKKVAFKDDKKKKNRKSEPEEDSEFDEDVFGLDSEDSVEPAPKKKTKEGKQKKKAQLEPEEDSEFDEDVFGLDSEDEVEEPVAKKKKKDALKGKQKKKKVELEPEEDSEFDEDVFGLDSEDEVEKPAPKSKKNDKKKDASNGKGKKKNNQPEPEPEEDSEFDEDVFGLDSEDEDEPAPKSKKDKKKVTFEKKASKNKKSKKQSESEPEEDSEFDEDVFGGDSEDDGLDNILDGIGSDSEKPKDEETPKEKSGIWEDIYGRKRDKDGNVIKEETGGKYIPPHMRARLEAAQNGAGDAKRQEKLARLKRTLKGQINRLAETNVHRISIELDNLYMQNARFDMNNLLTTLIMEAIVSNTLSPERMVLEHTLLVTILHANVGSEVGSHFLETIVERFSSLINQIQSFDVEDKTLDNCILILCHLYTFQIFKNKLIYDVIDQLLEKFCEKAVECILLVLRSIGFVLRKDDPLALKDMILKVQKRAAEAPTELKNDTRVKYMLDTLLAVKNNNMNKIPQYDPTLVEHFRKILKGMITSGKYVSSLNIGLDDLLNVEERGKWWLVGSAWMGDTGGAAAGGKGRGAGKNGAGGAEEEGFSQQLLELARKQRMNTDDKRNVFCAIMSAEDYLDAFDKILRLAIKDQRIVASVIVHCALAEKDYNPYYSVLSQKFCEYDRRYQLAIQYTIWDRLKDIQSLKQAPIRNLAKLLTHLIGEGSLALSVLKVIEFAEIDKPTLRLVRQTMLGLLLLEDENKCLQVFNRIAPSFKLKSFKDSLRLFLHHFLLKGSDRSGVPEEQMQLLHQRIKMAERMLDTSEARVQF